jgi:four helix bundle protein
MSRDYRKLSAFELADALVVPAYRATAAFPADERYGLRAQIRRAVVSVPTNIVEGSARRSLSEYLNFLNVATGSASEARYLLNVALRLGFVTAEAESELGRQYDRLMAALQALTRSLESLGGKSPRS